MKTTLFVIAAFLFSGVVSAQKANVKTTQSASVETNSVSGKASAQTASQADIKPGNVKAGTEGTADLSTNNNNKNSVALSSEGKTAVSAATETGKANELKNTANSATTATVKSTQNTTAAVHSDVKQTVAGTKATVKSVDAGVRTKAKIAASSSIKTVGAVHNNLKTPVIKTAANLKTNMKVGLR